MITFLLILTIAFDLLCVLAGLLSIKNNPNESGSYVILFFIILNLSFLMQLLL